VTRIQDAVRDYRAAKAAVIAANARYERAKQEMDRATAERNAGFQLIQEATEALRLAAEEDEA
jgi:hypothetical protein